jgi:peroxiredoxin Q/BCP
LRDNGPVIRGFDVAYFMISVDTPEENKAFAEKESADFPLLSDPSKAVAGTYGVLSPVGLARRWTFYIGPDGKILDIDKSVSTGTAGADLANKLKALGIKQRSQ